MFSTRWGRSSSTRIPLSGSRVSVSSPTVTTPRPSNTTRACSARGWRCHSSATPGCISTSVTVKAAVPKSPRAGDPPPEDAAVLGDRALRPAADRLGHRIPAPEHRPDAPRVGVRRGEQGQGVDRALVADEVLLGRCLVEDVAGPDDGSPLEGLAVLEDELPAGEVDDRLDAVAVRPDLDARRDPVELEPDPHDWTGSSRPAARAAFAFSAHASRTWSLCGRIGQCSSRLFISSQ